MQEENIRTSVTQVYNLKINVCILGVHAQKGFTFTKRHDQKSLETMDLNDVSQSHPPHLVAVRREFHSIHRISTVLRTKKRFRSHTYLIVFEKIH